MKELTKNPMTPLIKLAGAALGVGLLTACGGGSVNSLPGELTYAVGGSVSGLSGTLVLENDGGDDLSLASDGAFTLPTRMAQGGAYSITVAAQPAGEVCAVSDAAGMVDGTIG